MVQEKRGSGSQPESRAPPLPPAELIRLAEDALPFVEFSSALRVLSLVVKAIIAAHPSKDDVTNTGRLRRVMTEMFGLDAVPGRPVEDRTELLLFMMDQRVSDELDQEEWDNRNLLSRQKGGRPRVRGVEKLALVAVEVLQRDWTENQISTLVDDFSKREDELRGQRADRLNCKDNEDKLALLITEILRNRDLSLDLYAIKAAPLGAWEELVF